jgi:hypothetical protein
MFFSKMSYDICYHGVTFQLKTPLAQGQIKKQIVWNFNLRRHLRTEKYRNKLCQVINWTKWYILEG